MDLLTKLIELYSVGCFLMSIVEAYRGKVKMTAIYNALLAISLSVT